MALGSCRCSAEEKEKCVPLSRRQFLHWCACIQLISLEVRKPSQEQNGLVGNLFPNLWPGQEQQLCGLCFPLLSTSFYPRDFPPELIVRCVGLQCTAGIPQLPGLAPGLAQSRWTVFACPCISRQLPAIGRPQILCGGCRPSLKGHVPGRKTSASIWGMDTGSSFTISPGVTLIISFKMGPLLGIFMRQRISPLQLFRFSNIIRRVGKHRLLQNGLLLREF